MRQSHRGGGGGFGEAGEWSAAEPCQSKSIQLLSPLVWSPLPRLRGQINAAPTPLPCGARRPGRRGGSTPHRAPAPFLVAYPLSSSGRALADLEFVPLALYYSLTAAYRGDYCDNLLLPRGIGRSMSYKFKMTVTVVVDYRKELKSVL